MTKFKIDSLGVYIPLNDIQYHFPVDSIPDFVGDLEITSYRGEILSEKPLSLEKDSGLGYKYIFQTRSLFGKQFIFIMLTSKHLKGNYYDGINSDNFTYLLTEYFKEIHFDVTKKDVEKLLPYIILSDIDFCYDFFAEPHFMDILLNPPHDTIYKYYQTSVKGTRYFTGVQNSDRKSSTVKIPFFKIYHKEIEMNNNSFLFSQTYKLSYQNKGRVRFEFTLRGSKFKEKIKRFFSSTVTDYEMIFSGKDFFVSYFQSVNIAPHLSNLFNIYEFSDMSNDIVFNTVKDKIKKPYSLASSDIINVDKVDLKRLNALSINDIFLIQFLLQSFEIVPNEIKKEHINVSVDKLVSLGFNRQSIQRKIRELIKSSNIFLDALKDA